MKIRSLAVLLALTMTVLVPAGALADDPEPTEEPGFSHAQIAKIELLAGFTAGENALEAELETATASITKLREMGIGWGALFKLQKLAAALGTTAAALVPADFATQGEFNFGELKKKLLEDEAHLAAYESSVKNFGQLMKADKANKKANKVKPAGGDD